MPISIHSYGFRRNSARIRRNPGIPVHSCGFPWNFRIPPDSAGICGGIKSIGGRYRYPFVRFNFSLLYLFQRLIGFDTWDAFPYRKRDPIQEVADPMHLPVEVPSDVDVSSFAAKKSKKRPHVRKYSFHSPESIYRPLILPF